MENISIWCGCYFLFQNGCQSSALVSGHETKIKKNQVTFKLKWFIITIYRSDIKYNACNWWDIKDMLWHSQIRHVIWNCIWSLIERACITYMYLSTLMCNSCLSIFSVNKINAKYLKYFHYSLNSEMVETSHILTAVHCLNIVISLKLTKGFCHTRIHDTDVNIYHSDVWPWKSGVNVDHFVIWIYSNNFNTPNLIKAWMLYW